MTLTETQREALTQIAETHDVDVEFWPEEEPTQASFDPLVDNFNEFTDQELLGDLRATGLKVTVEEGVIYAKI